MLGHSGLTRMHDPSGQSQSRALALFSGFFQSFTPTRAANLIA
jgi:hypothetical protein